MRLNDRRTALRATQDWEDDEPGQTTFTGTGDNAFARVIGDPLVIVTLRAPFPEAALVELKLAAVRLLPVQSVRSFFGLGHFGRRVWFYHEVRPTLPEAVRTFWDGHEADIREGLLGQGEREIGIAAFRRRMVGLCHSGSTIDALFAHSTQGAQGAWAQQHWFNTRWRLATRVHPLARPIDDAVRHTLAVDNFRLQWRLLGRYLDLERGPAWLTTAGHKALRAGASRVRIEPG